MKDFYLDARDVCLETMKLYLGTCKKYVWVVVNSPDSRLDSQYSSKQTRKTPHVA